MSEYEGELPELFDAVEWKEADYKKLYEDTKQGAGYLWYKLRDERAKNTELNAELRQKNDLLLAYMKKVREQQKDKQWILRKLGFKTFSVRTNGLRLLKGIKNVFKALV